jgi:hypothetical protein
MGNRTVPDVEDVIVIGRTVDQYLRMFDLRPADVRGRSVLDCPSGAASFVSTAAEWTERAVGADVTYGLSPTAMERRCEADYQKAVTLLESTDQILAEETYDDVEQRKDLLRDASRQFAADYAANPQRYVRTELPVTPFADDAFSLVLSAHFLFLYSDRLDYDFHLETLRELARVAADEVRVFPLIGMDTKRYPRLDALVDALAADGHAASVESVPYESLKNGNEMLVIEP